MTTQQDEHFSALVDGELDNANSEIMLNRLAGDAQSRQRWYRYHLISDTLRSNLPDNIDPDFSRTIMAAIADEPAILAPRQKPSHTHPFKHRVAGFAIAASVAVVAVVGVQNMNGPTKPAQVAQMPSSSEFVRLAKEQPQAPQAMPAQQRQMVPQIFPGAPAMTVSSTQSSEPVDKAGTEYDPRLHQYIVNHNQRVSGGQFQGIMPYVRIVVSPGTVHRQGQK